MPSGIKRLIMNTRERAVSTDINRMQAMAAGEVAEGARYLMLAMLLFETGAGGIAVVPSATTTPLNGMILNGLMVQPQIASAEALITPGAAWVVDPDASPTSDDSPLKFVNDPGLGSGSGLTLTANASGSTRVDIVECRRVETVLETSNRDIYNETTGLFTPTTVDKVAKSLFEYRITLGTPGAGLPAFTSGWMPLMVATVPNGVSDWDGVTCFDVRRLYSDSVGAPCRITREMPLRSEMDISVGRVGAGAVVLVRGRVEGTLGDFKVGGVFDEGGALPMTTHAEPGFVAALAANRVWFLYAMFPAGLPRWCQYTPASSMVRQPGMFRGIPVASVKRTANMKGTPLTALTPPAYTGMAAAAGDVAVCVFAGAVNTATSQVTAALTEAGGRVWHPMSPTIAGVVSGGDTLSTFTFDDATGYYPPHARKLIVRFTLSVAAGVAALHEVVISVLAGTNVTVLVGDSTDAVIVHSARETRDGAAFTIQVVCEVPMIPTYPDALGLVTPRKVLVSHTGHAGTVTSTAAVIGWKL